MLEFRDCREAAELTRRGLENAFRATRFTCDFARQTHDVTHVGTAPYTADIITGIAA